MNVDARAILMINIRITTFAVSLKSRICVTSPLLFQFVTAGDFEVDSKCEQTFVDAF